MGIAGGRRECLKPKYAGLLFFSLEPEKHIPGARIDVTEFWEDAGGVRIEEKTFQGPLHQQLRDALRYIQNTVIKTRIVKHPDRAEADRFCNCPCAAIAEGLANAAHTRHMMRESPSRSGLRKTKSRS